MKNRLARSVTMGAALLALGIGGFAQAETKAEMKTKPPATAACTMDDAAKVRSVMQFVHAANQSEIRLGKIAQSKSQNADVKAQADRMVKDHTEADKKISDLAAKENVKLDAPMVDPLYLGTVAAEDTFAKELSAKSGTAFDMSYIGHSSSDHRLVLKVLEEGTKAAKGQTQQAFEQLHATVASHKEQADKTMKSLQGTPPKAVGGGPTEMKPKKPEKPKNPDETLPPDIRTSPPNKPSPDINYPDMNNPDTFGPKY
jgi:putative membrane protein